MARLTVRIQPGARRTAWIGWFGEHPKLAVAARPVDGAANEEARRFIAATAGVRDRQVRLVVGAASRAKHFEVDGVDDTTLRASIEAAIGSSSG